MNFGTRGELVGGVGRGVEEVMFIIHMSLFSMS